jgi:O-antigen/teichoic acid export membrane protein
MDSENTRDFFIKAASRIFSMQVVGLGCGFLIHFVLASHLSPSEFGIYSFVFSAATIGALLGNFGFQASAVRIIPQIIEEEDKQQMKKFVLFSSLWVFVLSGVVGLISYFVLNNFVLGDEYPKSALLVLTGLTPLVGLMKLNSGILKGFKKGALAVGYENSFRDIAFFLVIAAMIFMGFTFTESTLPLLLLLGIITLFFIVSWAYIWQFVDSYSYSPSNTPSQSDVSYKTWLSLSMPMMFVISVQFLILRSDIFMLGLLTTTVDVGVYSAGSKLAQAATLAMVALNIIFSPRASELFQKQNYKGLRRLYFKTLKYQALLSLFFIVVLAILAPYILAVLGEGYTNALPVIYVLLTGYALNALWGPIPFLMIMTKYEMQAMWLTFGAAILNIVLNIIFINQYGILGAAIATVIAINLRNGVAFFYILKCGVLNKNHYG